MFVPGLKMVPRAGFEPATFPLGGGRSILLSYRGGIWKGYITQIGLIFLVWGSGVGIARRFPCTRNDNTSERPYHVSLLCQKGQR